MKSQNEAKTRTGSIVFYLGIYGGKELPRFQISPSEKIY